MIFSDLVKLVAEGESETLEFKKSTGQLQRAGETLCAFLNGKGGRVFFGVTDSGKIVGQEATDSTLQAIAEMIRRLEPSIHISVQQFIMYPGS